jgi:hypothetical protein
VTAYLRVAFIVASGALAGAVVGIVLLVLKRPMLAHRVAKRATLSAVVVFGVLVAELQLLVRAPRLVVPFLVRVTPGDPSSMARALAESISELMNCAALAVPAVWLGGIGWFVARRRVKGSAAVTRP